ncbi:hypothetical protein V2G26_003448 [Clonostachys chloroleuca]
MIDRGYPDTSRQAYTQKWTKLGITSRNRPRVSRVWEPALTALGSGLHHRRAAVLAPSLMVPVGMIRLMRLLASPKLDRISIGSIPYKTSMQQQSGDTARQDCKEARQLTTDVAIHGNAAANVRRTRSTHSSILSYDWLVARQALPSLSSLLPTLHVLN